MTDPTFTTITHDDGSWTSSKNVALPTALEEYESALIEHRKAKVALYAAERQANDAKESLGASMDRLETARGRWQRSIIDQAGITNPKEESA